MLAFKREAEAVLREGGYQLQRLSGKEHPVWKHPDPARPPIHVPGSPRDPDHALIRIRRAVRKGTTPHIPQGVEAEVATKTKHVPNQRSLAEQLVRHAPAALHRRAANPEERLPADKKELGAWMRKCIESHGTLPGSAIREAAKELRLAPEQVSAARREAGAATYRLPGAAGKTEETYTDFVKRIPANAIRMTGRTPGTKNKTKPNGHVKVVRPANEPQPAIDPSKILPPDPDTIRGRRLDRPEGMTDEQYAEAERMMRESTARADAELAERRAAANGNGHTPAEDDDEMSVLLAMVRETALKQTKALTKEDLMLIRGHMDTLRRRHDEDRGIIASITGILDRVEARS